jgi:hypothetical protein
LSFSGPAGILESNFIIYTDVAYFLKCKIIGIIAKSSGTTMAKALPKNLITGVNLELFTPKDWKAL